jgi:1,2-phenylacetyl-CoA epoxidase PaaB subunit
MKYEVFTRINAGDDLMHVGCVEASNDRLARTYAHTAYDEEDWAHMAVVRRDDLIEVGKPDQSTLVPSVGTGGKR